MKIEPRVIIDQQEAANPFQSVWVSASAGSGKTKVLTDRVLRLLLSDTPPEKILCLTFTKAAAAEMANRITNTLKKWTVADDKTVDKALQDLTGLPPKPELRFKARQLFIQVLETPGNMKIMNIHAFCQSVLKRFPIEAKVPPQFNVIDEAQSSRLMQEALNQTVILPDFQADIEYISDYLYDRMMTKLFKHIADNEVRYAALFDKFKSSSMIKKQLIKHYNLSKYHSENDILIEYYNPLKISNYTPKDITAANALLEEKAALYLNKDCNDINKKNKANLENPEAWAVLDVYHKRRLYNIIQTTGHVLHLTENVIRLYRQFKKEQSLLDYGDLINKTRQLLTQQTMSQWVMFKMDEGINHILVDEAQDTSPDQWDIIRLISEEFFAGLGRDTGVERTIFVVGDKKQSIYSFQGADPEKFEEMHTYFKERVLAARKTFKTVPLNTSFRSVSIVLDVVNFMLNNKIARKGVLNQNEKAVHTTTRIGEGGNIEVWPLVTIYKEDANEAWALPERIAVENPVTVLARQIGDKIKDMLVKREKLVSTDKPIEPKDIMILVSKRTQIVPEIVRALKERNIPVAGIDRLDLSSHIAIQDLMAVAEFVLLPEDNLNLATLLKSPLFHLTEDDLMQLCINRQNKSVWERLQSMQPDTAEQLKTILNQADRMPVYEFFAHLLGPLGGRKAFIARLGTEVNEAIDEFLNLCLQFEQEHTPSLQGFLNWFKTRNNVIKRDMDQSEMNTVKIMTVHGSKGLQGKIVFLPDAQRLPTTETTFLWQEDLPLWIATSGFIKNNSYVTPLLDKAKQESEEEYHRLLYVALTRACDRLYICGWNKIQSKQKSDKKKQTRSKTENKITSWYDLIKQSLNIVELKNDVFSLSCEQSEKPEEKHYETNDENNTIVALPDYLKQQAPTETPLSKPLMPSRIVENETPEISIVGVGQEAALKRGSFIHKLLQYLPAIPAEKRRETAMRLKPDDIDIDEKLFDLFENTSFSILFSQNSVAEAPIVGIVGNRVFSGQIDRLIVLKNEVWIVDYKTNRFVPQNPTEVSHSYKIQLFAYKELIKNIFADKVIKTFLLWTENLSLMEMTDEINKMAETDIVTKDVK